MKIIIGLRKLNFWNLNTIQFISSKLDQFNDYIYIYMYVYIYIERERKRKRMKYVFLVLRP